MSGRAGKGHRIVRAVSPKTASWSDVDPDAPPEPDRLVRLTPASQIAVRPVRWIWEDRLPLGGLALMGGREGLGKSILADQLAADVTNGCLLGQYAGQPKSVIIAAAEDSWDRTIVPRLMAAGADLDRVFRVDVVLSGGAGEVELSLPDDLPALEEQILLVDAALVLLDPLLSRLSAELDSHKDAEVRSALEPIVRIADSTGICVLGLIHVNKGTSADPLTMLMGSRAFVAVARAVLFVMVDPEDEEARIVGQAKNNLGGLDVPSLTFTIEDAHVCDTPEGPVHTGRLQWTGETDRSIAETVEVAADAGGPSVTEEAADWLVAYLNAQEDGSADSATVKAEPDPAPLATLSGLPSTHLARPYAPLYPDSRRQAIPDPVASLRKSRFSESRALRPKRARAVLVCPRCDP